MSESTRKIGEHWSKVEKEAIGQGALKLRWWQSRHVIKHINHIVCGNYVDGVSQGLINRVREFAGASLPLKRGISVGGGNGQKEINLIQQGIVESFDLFELSEERIAVGSNIAKKRGLADRITFINGDAFVMATNRGQYDLVHWNNSLHHMPDVHMAVKWSKDVLRAGGLFYMDDFVGSSRFQWSERQLKIATNVRRVFRETKYLANPRDSDKFLPTEMKRPDTAKLIASDPSEAADSERIIDAIRTFFPRAVIEKTGGVIYHLALSDMLHNFQEEDEQDKILLNLLLMIDELCIELDETHYAVALAFKDGDVG